MIEWLLWTISWLVWLICLPILLVWNNLFVAVAVVVAFVGGIVAMRWQDGPEIDRLSYRNAKLYGQLAELEEGKSGAVEEARRLECELARTDDDIRQENRKLQERLKARDEEARERIEELKRAIQQRDKQIRDLHEANKSLRTANARWKARIEELRSRRRW